jgi:tRNA A37 N6-isopentenylltransferase MiaA
MEKQIQVKEEAERENSYVLEEQRNQEKLEKELREIDLEIGTIYDGRDERKRVELLELERLDEKIFKLRQELRGSKVRQLALEEELASLSKLIV